MNPTVSEWPEAAAPGWDRLGACLVLLSSAHLCQPWQPGAPRPPGPPNRNGYLSARAVTLGMDKGEERSTPDLPLHLPPPPLQQITHMGSESHPQAQVGLG